MKLSDEQRVQYGRAAWTGECQWRLEDWTMTRAMLASWGMLDGEDQSKYIAIAEAVIATYLADTASERSARDAVIASAREVRDAWMIGGMTVNAEHVPLLDRLDAMFAALDTAHREDAP
jgi:hypothetical protein